MSVNNSIGIIIISEDATRLDCDPPVGDPVGQGSQEAGQLEGSTGISPFSISLITAAMPSN